MIDAQTITPRSLPSVTLSERALLPKIRAVYFVIADGEVVYIGKAVRLGCRWRKHHKLSELGFLKDVRIAWLACDGMTVAGQADLQSDVT